MDPTAPAPPPYTEKNAIPMEPLPDSNPNPAFATAPPPVNPKYPTQASQQPSYPAQNQQAVLPPQQWNAPAPMQPIPPGGMPPGTHPMMQQQMMQQPMMQQSMMQQPMMQQPMMQMPCMQQSMQPMMMPQSNTVVVNANAAPASTVIISKKRGIPHWLHCIISIFFPPWLFVWCCICLCNRNKDDGITVY